MALNDTLARAVQTANNIFSSVKDSVVHHTWIEQDKKGDVTYLDVNRAAIVEQKTHQRQLSNGQTVEVRATLTFLDVIPANGAVDRAEPVDPRDEFTLSDGYRGQIVDAEGLFNPGAGQFVTVVYLGNDQV